MYWKGHTIPGSTCNKLASNIDIFPTFAELSGAPLPEHKIDGVSIRSLIEGVEGANPRENFVYYYNKNDLEAVTDGEFKLILPHKYLSYSTHVPGSDGQSGNMEPIEIRKCELYDLRRDPGERYEVFTLYPDRAAKLLKVAEEMRKDLGDNLTRVRGTGHRELGWVKK